MAFVLGVDFREVNEDNQNDNVVFEANLSTQKLQTFDETASEKKEYKYTEPLVIDSSLDSPKFDHGDMTKNLPDLLQVIGLDYEKMGSIQRDMQRTHISEFCNFYKDINVFKQNTSLEYNDLLITTLFEKISIERHPSLDKLLIVLMIASRNFKGPNGGNEPRIKKIIDILNRESRMEIIIPAIKSLINYAEVNTQLIIESNILEFFHQHLGYNSTDLELHTAIICVLRNMTVNDVCRKKILEKSGYLIVNCINTYNMEHDFLENAFWVLGNIALADDVLSLLLSIGALITVKNAMNTHSEKGSLIEAGLWFFYNVTYDQFFMKNLFKIGLEEAVIGWLKKNPHNKTIQEWCETIIKRLRTAFQALTPAAVAERNMNRSIRDGFLYVQLGLLNRSMKKFVVLQSYRIVYSTNPRDPEIDGEIKLREVKDVILDKAKPSRMKIITKNKIYQLYTVDNSPIEEWENEVRSTWKSSVSCVIENHPNPDEPIRYNPFLYNVLECIPESEVQKYTLNYVLHEIYNNPHFLMHEFNLQKSNPLLSLWDWALTNLAVKLAKSFREIKLDEEKNTERNMYELAKMKKEIEKFVENRLMSEVMEFEKNLDLKEIPNVITKYEYYAKQGIRPTMEDRHIHMPYIDTLVGRQNQEPVSYYAVYDGHGGFQVAEFLEANLHINLLSHPLFDTDIKKALYESFMKTQEDIKESADRIILPATAGSTAVTILFKGNKMYCTWAGDSLATLYRKNEHIELVDPHKPGKESERERIEKLGGFVNDEAGILRVNGAVAVSRAFGNIKHRVIIPEPDIKEIELNGEEEFIILACDGLWDVMTPEEGRNFVKNYLNKHGKRTKGISEALVDEALRLGSTDNVSVVFIEFTYWKGPKRN